jgi:MSHA biogenesis protein MshI
VNALEHIVLELQRSLDYYDSHFTQPPVQAVYVAPMAPDLPFVAEYLQRNLPMQVATMDLQQMFPDARLPADDSVAYCLTAIGAALRVEELTL